MVTIRLVGLASGEASYADETYLVSYDSSHEDERGIGVMESTNDKTRAKRFSDAAEAMEFWRQRSKTVPTRPDGKPNRPLTAFTVLIEKD